MSRLRRDDGATDAKWFGGGGDIFGPVMLALRLGCSLAEEPPHCAYESIVEENRMWRYWVVRIGLWYDWLPGQGSWEMVAEFTKGYTEPMHNLSLSISVRGTQRLVAKNLRHYICRETRRLSLWLQLVARHPDGQLHLR